jgi:hypothetical protein
MTQHVDPKAAVAVAAPVSMRPMTRIEKLQRLAQLFAKRREPIVNARRWEYIAGQQEKDALAWPNSVMEIAAADPVFRDAGLTGETVGDFRKFFELDNAAYHIFACNCHNGEVSTGGDMAFIANYLIIRPL